MIIIILFCCTHLKLKLLYITIKYLYNKKSCSKWIITFVKLSSVENDTIQKFIQNHQNRKVSQLYIFHYFHFSRISFLSLTTLSRYVLFITYFIFPNFFLSANSLPLTCMQNGKTIKTKQNHSSLFWTLGITFFGPKNDSFILKRRDLWANTILWKKRNKNGLRLFQETS